MKKYLITDPKYYTQDPSLFKERLSYALELHHPELMLYRDKENADPQELSKVFVALAKEYQQTKSFLHSDFILAHSLGADGVHLTYRDKDSIHKAKELGLEVIVSTHSHEEAQDAQQLGADYITYSPIFTTPNKGEPKGLEDLQELLQKVSVKVIALGGIVSAKELEALKQCSVYGFASIRYFTHVL